MFDPLFANDIYGDDSTLKLTILYISMREDNQVKRALIDKIKY